MGGESRRNFFSSPESNSSRRCHAAGATYGLRAVIAGRPARASISFPEEATMTARNLLTFIALSLLAVPGGTAAADPRPSPTHVADGEPVLRLPYLDDVDGRRIARLEVFAPRSTGGDAGSGGASLKLVASATGPEVDPVSGYEGIGGDNRFTAEQIARILDGSRRLRITARDLATGTTAPVRLYAGAYGTVPQRRLRADGTIDHLAQSARRLPLDLRVEAGPFAAGRHELELSVDGEPRLRVTLTRGPGGAITVDDVQGLGAHGARGGSPSPPRALTAAAAAPLFLAQLVAPPGDAADPDAPPPGPPPVEAAEWAGRDLEGKWALYAHDVARHPESAPRWVQFLADERDHAFLEWIAIYQHSAFSSLGVGMMLAEAEAPQWARVGVWMRHDATGHGHLEAQAILGTHPGRIRWWLGRHPDAAPELLEAWADEAPVASPDLLPPLTPESVYGLLDAPPAELSEFGGGQRSAEPGKTYVQQVVRAVRGYAVAGRPGEPWEPRLAALTRHANAAVRREAYLAFTHRKFAPLPRAGVLKVINDPEEHATVREAAALAFSYDDHPSVYAELHPLAADPAHPAWPAAVSRLGDLGDGFTLARLEGLTELSPAPRRLVTASVRRIRDVLAAQEAALARDDPNARHQARATLADPLRHAAWVDVERHPLAATLIPWTIDATRKQAGAFPAVRDELAAIARDGVAIEPRGGAGEEDDRLDARVKEYAGRILQPAGEGADIGGGDDPANN
jgi:hypothetical protein